jgi:SAM-dependent methyltransferase
MLAKQDPMVLSRRNLDTFAWSRAIRQALSTQLPQLHGKLLDIGCGRMPYKPLVLSPTSRVTHYIGLDFPTGPYADYGPFDLEWDGRHIPLPNGSIDCAMATEVLEQCPSPEIVLAETARVLKVGGLLFFSVPFLWPIHDPPSDQYRFTPYALRRLLNIAGFDQIELSAGGGWDASLAQMIGLWVMRRQRGHASRAILSGLALPILRILISKDQAPDLSNITETIMIIGVTGTARRT